MTATLAALESEALALTPEERVVLVDRLLSSLDREHEIETAWAAEVERRLAEIEAGRGRMVPVEQAIQRARQALE